MRGLGYKGNRQGDSQRIQKRDDLDHWAMLDSASKKAEVPKADGKKISGKRVRFYALEWLRLESIRLAFKTSPQSLLRLAKTQDADIRHALGAARDGLIELPPNPITWGYPYYERNFERAFSFEVLKPGDIHIERLTRECRHGRVVISIDPRYGTSAIDALRKLLASKRNGKPDRGAGPKVRLLRLREALLSYETWLAKAPIKQQQGLGPHIYSPTLARDKSVMQDIGKSLRSYPAHSEENTEKNTHLYEKRAQEILSLAREMLHTAACEDTNVWPGKFR